MPVADCGRLPLGVARWAATVGLLQVVDKLPNKKWQKILQRGTPNNKTLSHFFPHSTHCSSVPTLSIFQVFLYSHPTFKLAFCPPPYLSPPYFLKGGGRSIICPPPLIEGLLLDRYWIID